MGIWLAILAQTLLQGRYGDPGHVTIRGFFEGRWAILQVFHQCLVHPVAAVVPPDGLPCKVEGLREIMLTVQGACQAVQVPGVGSLEPGSCEEVAASSCHISRSQVSITSASYSGCASWVQPHCLIVALQRSCNVPLSIQPRCQNFYCFSSPSRRHQKQMGCFGLISQKSGRESEHSW